MALSPEEAQKFKGIRRNLRKHGTVAEPVNLTPEALRKHPVVTAIRPQVELAAAEPGVGVQDPRESLSSRDLKKLALWAAAGVILLASATLVATAEEALPRHEIPSITTYPIPQPTEQPLQRSGDDLSVMHSGEQAPAVRPLSTELALNGMRVIISVQE